MGEGGPRPTKRAITVSGPRALAGARNDDRIAVGTQPPAEVPLTGRTTTLADPLTTSLLAEVARQSRTLDLGQAQLDDAKRAAEPDDDSVAVSSAGRSSVSSADPARKPT